MIVSDILAPKLGYIPILSTQKRNLILPLLSIELILLNSKKRVKVIKILADSSFWRYMRKLIDVVWNNVNKLVIK